MMLEGGATSCPSARCPVDGTYPTGTTRYEKRSIARLEIPIWDSRHLHRLRQVRAGVPARRHPHQGLSTRQRSAARPDGLQVQAGGPDDRDCPNSPAHDPGRTRRLHRMRCVRGRLPGQEQGAVRHKAINMAP